MTQLHNKNLMMIHDTMQMAPTIIKMTKASGTWHEVDQAKECEIGIAQKAAGMDSGLITPIGFTKFHRVQKNQNRTINGNEVMTKTNGSSTRSNTTDRQVNTTSGIAIAIGINKEEDGDKRGNPWPSARFGFTTG